MARVTIVDYGLANLRSVINAFEYFGAEIELAKDGDALLKAERIVLPGVGAFDAGPQQHVPVKAHTEGLFAVELGGKAMKRIRIAVDDGHLVSEPRQRFGQRRADPAAAHHHNPHLKSFRLSAPGRHWPERYLGNATATAIA